jgi:hypothetical protein
VIIDDAWFEFWAIRIGYNIAHVAFKFGFIPGKLIFGWHLYMHHATIGFDKELEEKLKSVKR